MYPEENVSVRIYELSKGRTNQVVTWHTFDSPDKSFVREGPPGVSWSKEVHEIIHVKSDVVVGSSRYMRIETRKICYVVFDISAVFFSSPRVYLP